MAGALMELRLEYEELAAQQAAQAAIFQADMDKLDAKMADAEAIRRRLQDIQFDPKTTQEEYERTLQELVAKADETLPLVIRVSRSNISDPKVAQRMDDIVERAVAIRAKPAPDTSGTADASPPSFLAAPPPPPPPPAPMSISAK